MRSRSEGNFGIRVRLIFVLTCYAPDETSTPGFLSRCPRRRPTVASWVPQHHPLQIPVARCRLPRLSALKYKAGWFRRDTPGRSADMALRRLRAHRCCHSRDGAPPARRTAPGDETGAGTAGARADRAGPSLSADEERRLEAGFAAVESQQVELQILSIDVFGDHATVRVSRRDIIQIGGGEQIADTMQTITLRRLEDGWMIEEIES